MVELVHFIVLFWNVRFIRATDLFKKMWHLSTTWVGLTSIYPKYYKKYFFTASVLMRASHIDLFISSEWIYVYARDPLSAHASNYVRLYSQTSAFRFDWNFSQRIFSALCKRLQCWIQLKNELYRRRWRQRLLMISLFKHGAWGKCQVKHFHISRFLW